MLLTLHFNKKKEKEKQLWDYILFYWSTLMSAEMCNTDSGGATGAHFCISPL